jgi:branched-chain amino acid transport system ATP-binding protein
MLDVQGLYKRFGGLVATNDVSLRFETGSLTAIIGPNGAGKTTFFNLISGAIRPDSGRVLLDGEDLVGLSQREVVKRGMVRAFQVASVFPTFTVEEAIAAAVTVHRGRSLTLGTRFPLPQVRDGVDEALQLLGLTHRARTLTANLSHGDQKLLDIGLALALQPRVLLLDEPTAGMGTEERWAMIDKVYKLWERTKISVLFIEHDMDIVFKIAGSIRVLCYGAVLAEGTADEIRANPAVIDAYLGKAHEDAA